MGKAFTGNGSACDMLEKQMQPVQPGSVPNEFGVLPVYGVYKGTALGRIKFVAECAAILWGCAVRMNQVALQTYALPCAGVLEVAV